MPRLPRHSRTLLPVATLLTAAVVAAGVYVAPVSAPVRRLVVTDAPSAVAGAGVSALPAASSRSSRERSSLATRAEAVTGTGGATGKAAPETTAAAPEAASLDKLAPYKVAKAGQPIAKLPPGPVPGDPFTFQIGTLNILGSQHARNGTGRAAALAGAITGRGIDIVGLQEVQDDQLAVMQSRLSGYTVWPGQALGNQGVRLQIAFRDDLFELVDTGSILTRFDFQMRPIPWVLLRDRATQAEFYVIDVHNSPRDQEADRDAATGSEISLINSLRASGKPVLIVGDTNEHTEFACRVMAATGMVGYNGANASSGCYAGAGPIKIDWILGAGGTAFSGGTVDYGAPVSASTDHAFVHATVTVTPLVDAADTP